MFVPIPAIHAPILGDPTLQTLYLKALTSLDKTEGKLIEFRKTYWTGLIDRAIAYETHIDFVFKNGETIFVDRLSKK